MIDDYLIYEYKHFRGFLPHDASGGPSPAPTPSGPTPPSTKIKGISKAAGDEWTKFVDKCPSDLVGAPKILSVQQVAEAWLYGGGSKDSCPAALIVASGEGAPGGPGPTHFYNSDPTQSGADGSVAGPWQVDMETFGGSEPCKKNGSNPCCNANCVLKKFNVDWASPGSRAEFDEYCHTKNLHTLYLRM